MRDYRLVDNGKSSDHPIRPRQHVGRDGEADLFGSIQIDDQFKIRGLFDRKLGWRSAFQNLVT
jgi:hypothetical protein